MKRKQFFPLIGVAVAMLMSGVASASPIYPTAFAGLPGDNPALDGLVRPTQWASETLITTFSGQPADRDNPDDVLGEPDELFYELGLNQVGIWKFDEPVSAGYVTLFEVTNPPVSNWPESVRVLGGNADDFFFELIGDVTNAQSQNGWSLYFDFDDVMVDAISLTDTSGQLPFTYDVDAIGLTGKMAQVPVPAPATLMALGLGGIFASRRLKRNSAKNALTA